MSGKYQFTSYDDGDNGWSTEQYAFDSSLTTSAVATVNNRELYLWLGDFFDVTHILIKGNKGADGQAHIKIAIVDENGDEPVIAEDVTLSFSDITIVAIGSKQNCQAVIITALNACTGTYHIPIFIYDCRVGCMPDAPVVALPAVNATGVAVNTPLTWTGNDSLTDTYKVYLGTDNPPTNIVNGHSQAPANPNTYTPAVALNYGATYYWRIDAVNEMGTTQGTVQSFATPTEFCRIYRGQDGVIDYNNPVALMALTGQVSIPNQSLPPNTIWYFVRRRVAPCGLESADSPACIVRIDSEANMIPSLPNTPTSVTVEQLVAGKFRLRWRYSKINEEVSPVEFHIYADSGSGFNFAVPTAVVSYKFGGHGEFKWDSDAYAHGLRVKFCIRARPLGEYETQNTEYVAAFADASGPPAINDVYAIVEQLP